MTLSRNADTTAAVSYHEATKHSVASVRNSAHMLDFTNQPRPWKLYEDDLPGVQLSAQLAVSGVAALDAVRTAAPVLPGPRIPSLEEVTAVLLLSAGITKQISFPGGRMAFRAAACTGALYHIELYAVTQDLPGLPAGVYHFGVHDNTLRRLREGDYRAVLAEAAGGEDAITHAPITIAYTSTFWRNAWKYQSRAYRHSYWDSGTVLANSLSAANAHRLPAKVVTGFADGQVNELLDVDGSHEATVALLSLGRTDTPPPQAPSVERLGLPTVPPSGREIDYPAIREMHEASALTSPEEVAAWRAAWDELDGSPAPATGTLATLSLLPGVEERPLEDVIIRRGSSRRFEPQPIGFALLSTLLSATAHPVPLDAHPGRAPSLTEAYVIANAVDGLDPGAYFYRRDAGALELLRPDTTREEAARLALHQRLGGDAAVNVYFLADLARLLERLGNRAYRAAHLEASITAGRMYLAAYALGLGATGITFYDDDVTAFFSPHAAGKSVMFLIAIGVPGRRPIG